MGIDCICCKKLIRDNNVAALLCPTCSAIYTLTPCKSCQSRYTGCHAKCTKYKQWSKVNDALREYDRRLRDEERHYYARHRNHRCYDE